MKYFSLILLGMLFRLVSALHAQLPEPPEDPDAGYEQILTGETVDKWEGDTEYWRFENGKLIGEITEDNLLEQNTFFIWDREVADFELKVEYRISPEGNSGINYRSEKVDGVDHALRGYKADFDGQNKWSGQLY